MKALPRHGTFEIWFNVDTTLLHVLKLEYLP
jgi:hypothetical protein